MIIKTWGYELFHYNHNHDPRDGRFTSGSKKWGSWRSDDDERYLGDYYVDSTDIHRRREDSGSEESDDINDRGYTYVYDPSDSRDDDFYTQFGQRTIDDVFGEEGKIAGYESAGKAFCDHIFDTNDYDEVKYTDTTFRNLQKRNGENYVMSLLEAPYDPDKSSDENRSSYEDRLVEYGASAIGIGMGAKRHPWLDEEAKEVGGRDGDTVRNDAARRVADILKEDGYIGMRDFKDIGGNADVESATILFGERKMRRGK